MKFNKFLGGDGYELFFEEVTLKFQVHKSLINENTKVMIEHYLASLQAPDGIDVTTKNNIYKFKPLDYQEDKDDFIWFAL